MTRNSRYPKEMVEHLCRLAADAGREAMRFYETGPLVTLKSDSSPLTEADRASHEFIVRSLEGLIPGVPVISEESQDHTSGFVDAGVVGRFWLVDPLDGTKEFLKRTGEFTVNIALVEQGRPVIGVVHAPVLALSYFADLQNGAFRQKQNEAPMPIRTQAADLDRARVVASKDHAGPQVEAMLKRLPNAELKSMGSSLKFCLVAAGEADIYLRDVPTMEWDTAAAQCVVEVAGGAVCTLDGEPLIYGKPALKNPSIITIGDPHLNWRPLIEMRQQY